MCFFTPEKEKENPFNNSNIIKTIKILIEMQTQNLIEFLPKYQKSKVHFLPNIIINICWKYKNSELFLKKTAKFLDYKLN